MNVRDRLCIALDFPDGPTALKFARRMRGRAGWWKVGLELFVSEGPALVSEMTAFGNVFLDLKLHDIPNTVAAATKAAVRTGAAMVNVHASGGTEMMEAARRAAEEEAGRLGRPRPLVVAVTLLTSIGADALAALPFRGAPADVVAALGAAAAGARMDGVVCSAGDVAGLRAAHGPDFLTVVPGIRSGGAEAGDQKRVATPDAALAAGASILVVGRPITRSDDPENALEAIVSEMERSREQTAE